MKAKKFLVSALLSLSVLGGAMSLQAASDKILVGTPSIDGKVDEKYTFNDDCVLPEGFAKKYFDAIDSLDDGVYIDVMTSGRLFSVVREYCSNGGDISAALESGKKNVSLYLSE